MVEAAAVASFGAWLYLLLLHGRFWRIRPLLAPADPLPEHSASLRIAVVIPARDEARTISECVRSLIRQDWPGELHIWVVDDSSADRTAEIAREAGGGRVSVLPAGTLPRGWTGKLWALECGTREARLFLPDFLLFTDADIVHAPDSIRHLVARAETSRRDLVSVMVRLHCESLAERLLIPAFVFFFFMLYPPGWIARSDRRAAGAAGGCILIRLAALERIGGLAAIRGELIDDCALARHVKRSGGSLWLGLSDSTRSIRPYVSFRDVRAMISRTAFTQLRYSPLLLAGTVLGMSLLYVVPVAAAVAGGLIGAAAWTVMAVAFMPMLRFYRQPFSAAMLLPVAGLFYTAATVESAIRYWTGRGGAWKGRHQAAAQQ